MNETNKENINNILGVKEDSNDQTNYVSYLSNKQAEPNNSFGGQYIGILKVFAWINFLCSIIAGSIVWSQFGMREGAYSLAESNPIGITLSVSFVFTGFVVLVLLLAICAILENTIALRKDFAHHKQSVVSKQ